MNVPPVMYGLTIIPSDIVAMMKERAIGLVRNGMGAKLNVLVGRICHVQFLDYDVASCVSPHLPALPPPAEL